jgi:hypothetical protein
LATYYVDAVAGNNTTGDGSSGNPWQTIDRAVTTAVAGDLAYIKASATYAITAAITLAASGSAAAGGITFEGYTTTPGDGGRATLMCGTDANSVDIFNLNGKSLITFRNLSLIHMASTTRGHGFAAKTGHSSYITIENCLIDGCNNGIYAQDASDWSINQLVATNTEIKNCTSHGAGISGNFNRFVNCPIHGNTGDGIRTFVVPSGTLILDVSDSRIYGNAVGVNAARDQPTILSLKNCTVYGNSSHGVSSGVTTSNQFVLNLRNNILFLNGGYGIACAKAPDTLTNRKNAYGGPNTSGDRSNLAAGTGDVSLTGDPFNGAGAGDFSLNDNSGAGHECRGTGDPAYLDIGGLQHQDSGGGGTSGYSRGRMVNS